MPSQGNITGFPGARLEDILQVLGQQYEGTSGLTRMAWGTRQPEQLRGMRTGSRRIRQVVVDDSERRQQEGGGTIQGVTSSRAEDLLGSVWDRDLQGRTRGRLHDTGL